MVSVNPIRNPRFLNKVNPLRCLAIIVLGVMVAGGIVYALTSSYYQIPGSGGSKVIGEHGICRRLTNNNPNPLFIGTNTSAEWVSFVSHPPANVTLVPCVNLDIVWSNTESYTTEYNAIAIYDNAIYIAGWDSSLGNTQWRIEKRDLLGNELWSKTSNPSNGDDRAMAIAVNGWGVFVAGYDSFPGGSDTQWRIERRDLATGNPSAGWPANGVTNNPSVGADRDDRATGIVLDGGIAYIAGYDSIPGAGNSQWRVEKRSAVMNGALWPNWPLPLNRTGNKDEITAIAIDIIDENTGAIYVAGHSNERLNGTPQDGYQQKGEIGKINITRDSSTPVPAWAWLRDSAPTLPSANDRYLAAVGVVGSGLNAGVYTAGYEMVTSGGFVRPQAIIEKRNQSNGAVSDFKSDDPEELDFVPNVGMAIDNTGIYLAGGNLNTSNNWKGEFRKYSFNLDKIWSGFDTSYSIANGVAVDRTADNDGFYMLTGNIGSLSDGRVERRWEQEEIKDLVSGIHSSRECTNDGGTVVTDGLPNKFCKFTSATCPGANNWTQYQNWSTTASTTCNAPGPNPCGFFQAGTPGCASASCTTPSHAWGNTSPDTCNYGGGCFDALGRPAGCQSWTCVNTNITQIGCY